MKHRELVEAALAALREEDYEAAEKLLVDALDLGETARQGFADRRKARIAKGGWK